MDAYGHVNNVHMVRLMEEARVQFFGPPPSAGEAAPDALVPVFAHLPEGTQALVSENHVKYKSPLPYRNQPARMDLWIQKITPASITIGYHVIDAATGTLCAEASTVLAFFHEPTGRLVRITPEQKAMLQEHMGD